MIARLPSTGWQCTDFLEQPFFPCPGRSLAGSGGFDRKKLAARYRIAEHRRLRAPVQQSGHPALERLSSCRRLTYATWTPGSQAPAWERASSKLCFADGDEALFGKTANWLITTKTRHEFIAFSPTDEAVLRRSRRAEIPKLELGNEKLNEKKITGWKPTPRKTAASGRLPRAALFATLTT